MKTSQIDILGQQNCQNLKIGPIKGEGASVADPVFLPDTDPDLWQLRILATNPAFKTSI
jgi:hypothetical protein